jgi:hypothetical protein
MLGTSADPDNSGRAALALRAHLVAQQCAATREVNAIARAKAGLNDQERTGAKTLEGLPRPPSWLCHENGQGGSDADRYPGARSDGLVPPGEAREGRPSDELGQGVCCMALEG